MSLSSIPDSGEGTASYLPFKKVFEAQAGLALLFSPDYTILGVSDSYLRETLTRRNDIIGRSLPDVFPDNPNLPDESPTGFLQASVKRAVDTGKPDKMEIFRYDIPNPAEAGTFLERYWRSTNTPIYDDEGTIAFILHETSNVTSELMVEKQLKESHAREQLALARAEQQRLRVERLFEQAPAACAMLEGPDFVYRMINRAYQQLFPGRELVGIPLFDALPELRHGMIDEIIHRVYSTGETYEGKELLIPVARYANEAPVNFYWNFIYQALLDEQGNVNGILIFALDVTESVEARQLVEKSAESLQALNRSLEERIDLRTAQLQQARAEAEWQGQRLQNLFMQAPAAICIFDGPDMVFELVNPGYAQLFPDRQLLGRPVLEALPEIKDNKVYRTLQEVYKTGKTHQESELYIPILRVSDGLPEDRYFRYVQQPRFDEQGRVDGITVFVLEVTEQVMARKEVEASAKQLQLVTDALPVLISYIDKEQRYQFVNKAYETWFPLKASEMMGASVDKIIGREAYENVRHRIEKALAGEQVNFEVTMQYRQDFMRHIQTSYVPDIQNGEVQGFFSLVSDVTQQVEARKEVERSEQKARAMADKLATMNQDLKVANREFELANQQLVYINNDLDNFIYTASHDLKTPISNIEMLMEELLLELPQDSSQQEGIGNILRMMQGAIARFKKTITSLTDISKIQKDSLRPATVLRISDIIREVILDLNQLIVRSGAQIEVAINEKATISFSEKNLRSILYNLLSNALKYSHPERKSQICITCHEDAQYLLLTVEDNGLGLTATQQKKLFSMFRRFHDHVEGSGVGLYMVKRMVENAGGKIEVQSEAGTGSTFRVYFLKQV